MCMGNQGFVGPKTYVILGNPFLKKEYNIRYKREY
jgi:hypothetical protein